MTEIKQYWIDGVPTIHDIKKAYQIITESNVVVQLIWRVEYSGTYKVYIKLEDTIVMTEEEFFNNKIPHVYGV